MDDLVVSLIVGISSSFLATALFILGGEFVRKTVLPWYGDRIYRGIRIDGKWKLTQALGINTEDKEIFMNLFLEQKGDVITGVYSHKDKDEVVDEYIIQGRLRDMYFLATAVPKSNRLTDAITLLFYINNVKSKLIMNGGMLHQSTPGEIGSTMDVEFQWENK